MYFPQSFLVTLFCSFPLVSKSHSVRWATFIGELMALFFIINFYIFINTCLQYIVDDCHVYLIRSPVSSYIEFLQNVPNFRRELSLYSKGGLLKHKKARTVQSLGTQTCVQMLCHFPHCRNEDLWNNKCEKVNSSVIIIIFIAITFIIIFKRNYSKA